MQVRLLLSQEDWDDLRKALDQKFKKNDQVSVILGDSPHSVKDVYWYDTEPEAL